MSMTAKEIRQSFLNFFRDKQHKVVPSAPVVPQDDPTLLFTNAGMNQFKNIFVGLEKASAPRVADTQKCIRVSGKHNDLEDVGFDTYHHTLFEMLGNWSFGDYYKKEAIEWAWELLTEVWGLDKQRLFVTVHDSDDEAAELWAKVTDIEPWRIMKFGDKDNFWEMGETGPCGPCSEIHYDNGDLATQKDHYQDPVGGVNGENERFIEIWNLVFIQYNREKGGKLDELPSKHVDTGMGFERIVAVMQDKKSNYDTDLFKPLLDKITALSDVEYMSQDNGMAHRVIADHVRALTFAIADGALPSNEGRGYVLRRILRRAARYGRTIGLKDPFIHELVAVLAETMGEAFPELREKQEYLALVIKSEEESFNATLDRGLEIFGKIVDAAKQAGKTEIAGEDAFKLYDTYGFPLDLTQLMARENEMSVDDAGFETAMAAQRKRAREAGKFEFNIAHKPESWPALSQGESSRFIGYTELGTDTEIRTLQQEGDKLLFTLAETPFYAESGGQVGDRGVVHGDGFEIAVENTVKAGSHIIHVGKLASGSVEGSKAAAEVDADLRLSTARNHTATHLLHAALRQTVGTHVSQAGSLVAPDRLRFDVTHFQKIELAQLEDIEGIVNEQIRADLEVETFEKSFVEARKMGAMAIFEEKYGEFVRVVKMGDYSIELCGGTHLRHTGETGMFRLASESSAAAGIRRLEALTGAGAEETMRADRRLEEDLKHLLQAPREEIFSRVTDLIEQKKQLERQIQELRGASARSSIADLAANARQQGDIRYVTAQVQAEHVKDLKGMADMLRDKLGSGVGVLAAAMNGKVSFVCIVTDDLIKSRKLMAGNIVKAVAAHAGGSGGGQPHMALAGGKDAAKIEAALDAVPQILSENAG